MRHGGTFAVSRGRVVASAMVAARAPEAKSSRKLFCSASGCASVMPRTGPTAARRRICTAKHAAALPFYGGDRATLLQRLVVGNLS